MNNDVKAEQTFEQIALTTVKQSRHLNSLPSQL